MSSKDLNKQLSIERKGEKHVTNKGESLTIIEYYNAKNSKIQFEDGTILEGVEYHTIIKGQITNPNTPIAYGVGYIGQGKYKSREDGQKTNAYNKWHGMMQRCYSEKAKETHKGYEGVIVSEEWCNFQNFAEWFYKNYNSEIMGGWHIDKDLICKNCREYNSENCCFLPQEINGMLISNKRKRGKYPKGIHKFRKGYLASLSKFGVQGKVGYFMTIEETFNAYKIAKENHIKEVANIWKNKLPFRTYKALINYKVEIDD